MMVDIDELKIENGRVVAILKPNAELNRAVVRFKPGTWELKKKSTPRTLSQNALAWTLIDQIAQRMGMSKTDVYRNYVRDVPGIAIPVAVRESELEQLREDWTSNGLGWQMETDDSSIDGCVRAWLYPGSSAFTTSQFARFLDLILQDCKTLEIDVPYAI